MATTNQVTIEGKLTRDAELKYTASQMAVCELSIAVNKSKKKGDEWVSEVSFFDVTAFSKVAEKAGSLSKGDGVLIVGELKQERWEKDGQKRSAVKIIANGVYAAAGDDSDRSSQERPARRTEHSQQQEEENPF